MRNNIPNANGTGVFEVPQDANDTTEVMTRGMIPLPAKFVALFLRGRSYTPMEVWDLLLLLLVDEDLQLECAALIDWL
jgi:hypothetical protein